MQERPYFVYVLSSLSRTLYTGVTNDLERRVAEHKEGKPGSFTARYNVTRLVYFERFETTSATRLPAKTGSSGCCAHRRLR
jgi:putative endonuclease